MLTHVPLGSLLTAGKFFNSGAAYLARDICFESSKNWMYSEVTTSQKNFPARASVLILSKNPAPPRRRYLILVLGFLVLKVLRIRLTIEPPVKVPYQTTSPSFFALSSA